MIDTVLAIGPKNGQRAIPDSATNTALVAEAITQMSAYTMWFATRKHGPSGGVPRISRRTPAHAREILDQVRKTQLRKRVRRAGLPIVVGRRRKYSAASARFVTVNARSRRSARSVVQEDRSRPDRESFDLGSGDRESADPESGDPASVGPDRAAVGSVGPGSADAGSVDDRPATLPAPRALTVEFPSRTSYDPNSRSRNPSELPAWRNPAS
jgi:hypothetical protein